MQTLPKGVSLRISYPLPVGWCLFLHQMNVGSCHSQGKFCLPEANALWGVTDFLEIRDVFLRCSVLVMEVMLIPYANEFQKSCLKWGKSLEWSCGSVVEHLRCMRKIPGSVLSISSEKGTDSGWCERPSLDTGDSLLVQTVLTLIDWRSGLVLGNFMCSSVSCSCRTSKSGTGRMQFTGMTRYWQHTWHGARVGREGYFPFFEEPFYMSLPAGWIVPLFIINLLLNCTLPYINSLPWFWIQ